jgi:hypothetical protein
MTEPPEGSKRALWLLRQLRLKRSHEDIAQVLGIPLAAVPERIDATCAWALAERILDPESAPDGVGSKRRSTPVLGRMKSYRESLR